MRLFNCAFRTHVYCLSVGIVPRKFEKGRVCYGGQSSSSASLVGYSVANLKGKAMILDLFWGWVVCFFFINKQMK